MKLGLVIGYWNNAGPPPDALEQLRAAESPRLRQHVDGRGLRLRRLHAAGVVGRATSTIRLGTGVTQVSARTPASTAMTAITLDHLSGGRLILGLGVSGPQVVEGWYGQRYGKPLARTREYVEILRRVFRREEVDFQGEHYQMPLGDDAGGTGLGKPLKSIVQPLRDDIPIHLGAEGPKNVALAAEIADGWLPIFFSPEVRRLLPGRLAEGFARDRRPGARRTTSR